MDSLAKYTNDVKEVKYELSNQIELALSKGIKNEQIIIDPGIGFAKNVDQKTYDLKIKNCYEVVSDLDVDILGLCEVENTKVLIFGKPTSRKGRRMGVVLSSNDDLNIARNNADKAARKIKIVS